jgi:hypothetical protein
MNPAYEFFTPAPTVFYPFGVSGQAKWIQKLLATCDAMARHRISARSWTQRMSRLVMVSCAGAVRSAWSMIKLITRGRIPICRQGVVRVPGRVAI